MEIGLQDIIGLFNIFVGLMLVAAFVTFGAGLIIWLVRIGTIHREEGVQWMAWGVNILFVLVIGLAIVQFFQNRPAAATSVVAFLIIIFFIWLVFKVATAPKEEEKH